MKQVLFRNGQASIENVPAPIVKEGHVLVEVAYSLISTGTEIAAIESTGKSIIQRSLEKPEQVKKVLNHIQKEGFVKTIIKVKDKLEEVYPTGYSCSGKIIQVGECVDNFNPGDLVACGGSGVANHAEVVLIPKNLLVKIPKGCDLKSAASVTLGAIAMQGIRRADPKLGESIALIGLGLLGQITIQLLKAAGARVIGFDLDQHRVKIGKNLGADRCFVSSEVDVNKEVQLFTNYYGVDATIITASSQSNTLVKQSMEITRQKGKVVVVGAVGLGLNRSPFYEKEIDFLISRSYGPGRYDEKYELKGVDYPYAYVRWTENRNMSEYLRLIGDGKVNLESIFEKEISINQADEAYKALQLEEIKPLGVLLTYKQEDSGLLETKLSTKINIPNVSKPKGGKINIAIIGAGNFAKQMHLPNLENLRNLYQIQAIVSSTGKNAKSVAERYGAKYASTNYHDILDDPEIDAVLICTRHNLHAQLVLDALKSRKHVYCEKPLALSRQELIDIVSFYGSPIESIQLGKIDHPVEKGSPVLMVGFNRRFSPAAFRAKNIIKAHQSPLLINYRVNAGYIPLDHWVHTEEGGGRIIGEACHMFDLFQFFVGIAKAEQISVAHIEPKLDYISRKDNIVATVTYNDGSIGTLTYTALGSQKLGKELVEIYSDETVLIIDDFKQLRIYGKQAKMWNSSKPDKGHKQALEAFANTIIKSQQWPISLDDIVNTTLLSFIAGNDT